MALAPHNNALAYAHFRLRGGFKASAILTALAMFGLGILIFITVRLAGDSGRTVFGWATACLGLGAASLLLFGPMRISNAIRQDIQSKMIESHRLMPLPPSHAISGYIIGGGAPAVIFFAGVFLVGGITASAAGINMARWTFACGVLLSFSVFMFVGCAFASMSGKMGAAFIFIPFLVLYMSGGGLLPFLPGITVLISPIIGQSVFDLRGKGFDLPATYAISFFMQMCFSSIFFIAAARKYRRADAIGMDSILGVLLLACWVAVSWIGMRAWEDFRPRGLPMGNPGVAPNYHVIISMIIALTAAIVPLVSNAREQTRWRWHERVRDPAPLPRPIPPTAIILAATVLIILLPLAPITPSASLGADVYLRCAAVIFMALAALHFVIASAYGLRMRAGFPVVGWLFAFWVLPILIDLVRFGLGDQGEVEPLNGFATISPIGTIIMVLNKSVVTTTPGLVIQFLILALAAVVWHSLRERRRVALPV